MECVHVIPMATPSFRYCCHTLLLFYDALIIVYLVEESSSTNNICIHGYIKRFSEAVLL